MQANQGNYIELVFSNEVLNDVETFMKFITRATNSKKVMIGLPLSLSHIAQQLMRDLMKEGITPITYINNKTNDIQIRIL